MSRPVEAHVMLRRLMNAARNDGQGFLFTDKAEYNSETKTAQVSFTHWGTNYEIKLTEKS
jgi:hypothetical protein